MTNMCIARAVVIKFSFDVPRLSKWILRVFYLNLSKLIRYLFCGWNYSIIFLFLQHREGLMTHFAHLFPISPEMVLIRWHVHQKSGRGHAATFVSLFPTCLCHVRQTPGNKEPTLRSLEFSNRSRENLFDLCSAEMRNATWGPSRAEGSSKLSSQGRVFASGHYLASLWSVWKHKEAKRESFLRCPIACELEARDQNEI